MKNKRFYFNEEPFILFLCTPSLGVLDSWLSVLCLLKQKLPDVNFIFLANKEGTINQLLTNSHIEKLASSIFDFVIFKSESGILLQADSIREAKILSIRTRILICSYSLKIFRRLNLKKITNYLGMLYKILVKLKFNKDLFNKSNLDKSKFITLFDICELSRPYNSDFYNNLCRSKSFSILHGTGIRGIQTNRNLFNLEQARKANTSNCTAYLHSDLEIPFYKENYNLGIDQIKLHGIPKHDENWICKLANIDSVNEEKFIFIISRPTNEWVTKERRLVFLDMIKSLALKYNFKLIIKLHPKETNKDLYKKVLNSGDYKINWKFSNSHPFALGKNCKFAISFYSGVPLDLLQLGVPTIELSDFTGIEHDDHSKSLRNKKGEAVREYRYLNLVLGASSLKEFEEHIVKILSNKSRVIDDLRKNYAKIFKIEKNSSDLISEEIKNAFNLL